MCKILVITLHCIFFHTILCRYFEIQMIPVHCFHPWKFFILLMWSPVGDKIPSCAQREKYSQAGCRDPSILFKIISPASLNGKKKQKLMWDYTFLYPWSIKRIWGFFSSLVNSLKRSMIFHLFTEETLKENKFKAGMTMMERRATQYSELSAVKGSSLPITV